MKDKEKNQKIFILGVAIFLLVALVILFVVRYTVFKTGKYLTTIPEEELIKKGYGTYKTAFSTGCLTASGKCSLSGVQYTTQYCKAHPDTGKGCLNSNGELTFGSQTITQNCLPNCRSNILSDVSGSTEYSGYSSVCSYPAPYNGDDYTCVPSNTKAGKYSVFNCDPNDPVGENSCNYVCGSDGVGPNGISGDSDSSLASYIPNCVGKKGNVITLDSFNWNLVGNIPNNGYKITKGYTIKNFVNTDGSNSLNSFNVDPPYLAPASQKNPNPISKSVISLDELTQLDNQLVVLENCTPAAPKPTCQNLYTYTPIEVGGNFTSSNVKLAPSTPINILQTKSCYVSPYWTPAPPAPYVAGYTGPYDNTTQSYRMLDGIGGIGITYEYQACLPSNYNLKQATTNPTTYNMPDAYAVNYQCLPLIGSTGTIGNDYCFIDKNYVPLPLVINPNSNSNYNICDTVFPDGSRPLGYNGNPVPGTIAQCQYMPDNASIDFSGATTDTIVLDKGLQDIIGNYIQLSVKDSSTNKYYFLGLTTSPCGTGTSSDSLQPLSNCSLINSDTTNGYNAQRCLFTYYGGDPTTDAGSAGIFWDRLNCDAEMIGLVNSINIIVSPRRPIISSTIIRCDLYGYVGNVFGQFYTVPLGSNNQLYFQPLTRSQMGISSNYNPQTFDVYYNTTSKEIEIKVTGNINPVTVDSFDGIQFSTNYINISGTAVSFSNITTRIPFEGPIIKTEGLDQGVDVTSIVDQQRSNPCYYNTCNPQAIVPGFPCFPKTCNLYYEYNTELC